MAKTSRSGSIVALVLMLALGSFSQRSARADYPKPSVYPLSWQLDFQHGKPKRIAVDVPGSPTPQAFWYMTYTVTNNTDKEQMFLPVIEILLNNGQVVRSDVNIPKRVFESIKNREHKKLLEPFTAIEGPLRIGPAEAVDGVAIWPETTPRMGSFSIFVTGLSGETVTMKVIDGKLTKVDQADQMKDAKQLVFLRKTLQIDWHINGDEVYPGDDQVIQDSEDWIMR